MTAIARVSGIRASASTVQFLARLRSAINRLMPQEEQPECDLGAHPLAAGSGMRVMAGWHRGGCAPATTAIGTTTGSAAAVRAVVVRIASRELAVQVVPDRLEHHVDIALDAKPRPQRRDVKLMWTEVVEDRGAAIEERLNIDELPRPVPLAEDSLTEGEATRPQFFRDLRERKIVGTGHAEHAR